MGERDEEIPEIAHDPEAQDEAQEQRPLLEAEPEPGPSSGVREAATPKIISDQYHTSDDEDSIEEHWPESFEHLLMTYELGL